MGRSLLADRIANVAADVAEFPDGDVFQALAPLVKLAR